MRLLYQVQQEYPHPEGEYWVPRRLGGSAPNQDDSQGDPAGRTARADCRSTGTDGVTPAGPKRTQERTALTNTQPALIACDVDGTLFDEDETITPRTRDAVRAAVAAGAHFVVATGPPPALDTARRRRARFRADGGVRQRRRHL